MSYGLGSETDELPAFVVIPDSRGLPAGGSINWTNGFLPAKHQGVTIRSSGTPIDDLTPGDLPSEGAPKPSEFVPMTREALLASLPSGAAGARLEDQCAAEVRRRQ